MEGSEEDKLKFASVDNNPSDLGKLASKGKKVRISGISLTAEDLAAIRLASLAQTGSMGVRDEEFKARVAEATGYLEKRGLQAYLVTLYTQNVDLQNLVRQLKAQRIRYNETPMGVEVFGPHAKIEYLETIQKKDIPGIHPIRQEFSRIQI